MSEQPTNEKVKRHALKTWPQFFNAILAGTKTFEARKNDRDFQAGDILELQEYDPVVQEFTGRDIERKVSYILNGPAFGVEEGFCIMGLAHVANGEMNEKMADGAVEQVAIQFYKEATSLLWDRASESEKSLFIKIAAKHIRHFNAAEHEHRILITHLREQLQLKESQVGRCVEVLNQVQIRIKGSGTIRTRDYGLLKLTPGEGTTELISELLTSLPTTPNYVKRVEELESRLNSESQAFEKWKATVSGNLDDYKGGIAAMAAWAAFAKHMKGDEQTLNNKQV